MPSNTHVVLDYLGRVSEGRGESEIHHEQFNVFVEGKKDPLVLSLDTKQKEDEPITRWQDKIQTAFHEAGHEIARAALFQDLTSPERISIVPGVTRIGGQYIVYAGVASHKINTHGSTTKEYVLSRLAQLIAGGEAQRLINRGHKSGGGQSNDISRVTAAAKYMIVSLGLDSEWGFNTPEQGQTMSDYEQKLSEKQKTKLANLVKKYVKDARKMAHEVLAINFETFVRLAVELAKKGEVYAEDIVAIYKDLPVEDYWTSSWAQRKTKVLNWGFLKVYLQGLVPHFGRNLEVVSGVHDLEPSQIADIDDFLEKKRIEAIAKAKPMNPKPVLEEADKLTALQCEALFSNNP